MEHLTAFSRWVHGRYFDPVQGWDTGHYYGNCTFANHTLFLLPPFEDAIVLGFGDDVRCGLHELGLPFGHDFVAREDGVVGDLWAMDYLGTSPIGRIGRGLYPPRSALVEMPKQEAWIERIRADWAAFQGATTFATHSNLEELV